MKNEGRRRGASSFLSIFMLVIIVSLLVLACSDFREREWMILIKENSEEAVLYEGPIQAGDVIGFHWIHSVEHIEWSETFQLNEEGKLYLIESRFAGFGAGIPHEHQDGFYVEEGMVVFEPKNHQVDYYDWIHSHTALPEITYNGEIMLTGEDLPHHQSLRMIIEER
ncbi:protein of unknown function [Tindallia magadiensis]|uniref:DUF1850 domain-containing protein n=2 Tax=Tindallia magadiensis TaxID=69895 RepID=A0A1I3CCX8_9FIRM|nr:protein of unknown function [Tindallia magadiensis]